ncbi:hypothetical protein EDB92DRAFT_1814664 [Lactarius akahatsu]|uniref:Uncharacterized protein n=1 Tax=Lactarius akahatsu TaxID=416441 RepID=A0AAD4LLL8_9AGAM|nr:hypothetical protein EDB92DRAFT_1814664 [Lactarius akahatsu]
MSRLRKLGTEAVQVTVHEQETGTRWETGAVQETGTRRETGAVQVIETGRVKAIANVQVTVNVCVWMCGPPSVFLHTVLKPEIWAVCLLGQSGFVTAVSVEKPGRDDRNRENGDLE